MDFGPCGKLQSGTRKAVTSMNTGMWFYRGRLNRTAAGQGGQTPSFAKGRAWRRIAKRNDLPIYKV